MRLLCLTFWILAEWRNTSMLCSLWAGRALTIFNLCFIQGHTQTTYAYRRRLPPCLLHHIAQLVRGNQHIAPTDSSPQGPALLSCHRRSQPVRSRTSASSQHGRCADIFLPRPAHFTSFLEGSNLAKRLGCEFIETSAKERINVDEVFRDLVREIRKHSKPKDR